MYQLLPFVSAFATAIPDLPVEVWCIILKLLDPASLLSTVRTFSLLHFIAQGDLTLRKTIEEATLDEQKQIFALWTQPRMTTRVSRQDYTRLFSKNVQKAPSIKHKLPGRRVDEEKLIKKSTAPGGGPMKKPFKNMRFNPYRL